ncbi:MAG: hypothetical protein IKD70_05690, partial [Eggerthellaceae bacterium]|nr:hypothetical protein [Eggerthellaceae bacterium]
MNTNRTMAPAETADGFAPSRRNFIKLSIGALTALPTVAAGTFAVPWARSEALADQSTDPVRVVAVTTREIGLAITDKADDGERAFFCFAGGGNGT